MDLDAGIGAAIGAGVASILDWFDRKRIAEMNIKLEKIQTKTEAMEKEHDSSVVEIRDVNKKMDMMLQIVSELRGEIRAK